MPIRLTLAPPALLDRAPIETVSLSEAGVERLYHGTSFLLGWRSDRGSVRSTVTVRLEEIAPDP